MSYPAGGRGLGVAELSRPVAESSTDGAESAVQRADGHKLGGAAGTDRDESTHSSRRAGDRSTPETTPTPDRITARADTCQEHCDWQLSTRESRPGHFHRFGFSDEGLSAAHYEFAQTRGQLTGQLIPVHAGELAFERGWFSLIALRGPRPVCVTGNYAWTSFRQGPSGALIAHKGEKTDWICVLRLAICDWRFV